MISEKDFQRKYLDALKKQKELLIDRKPDPSHDYTIASAIKLTKSDEEFSSLLQHVFSHHELNEFTKVTSAEVDPFNISNVSKFFHSRYFMPVTIVQGTDPRNPVVDSSEFLDKISSAVWGSGTNKINFLVGGIGSGKTTFLCNLLYSNFDALRHRKKIPVRINIDVEQNHQVQDLPETIRLVVKTVLNTLDINGVLDREKVDRLRRECSLFKIDEIKALDDVLSHLLGILKERHHLEVVLIIDNVDFLYHLGDRGFFSDHVHEDQKTAYGAIIDLVTFFWRKRGQYKSANLGINIVFSVRRDTLDFIKSIQNEVPILGFDDLAYSLVDKGKDGATAVINSRFDMLVELVGYVQPIGRQVEFRKGAEQLSKAYREPSRAGVRLFDDLWSLCRRGLRDIVNQMANYAWLEFNDERRKAATMRFSSQYYPSIIGYGTGGHRRYSQFHGNVPNIFLVNASSRNNEFAVPEDFKKPHFFTLWLKYLMLAYVGSKAGEIVTSEDIISLFSGRNRRAYPESLVRYVLGALTEVPASELVEVDVAADGDGGKTGFVRDMRLTKRGEFILNNFCFSFSYLQMVVDDWRLRFPRELGEFFNYLEPDYKYLVCEDGEYGRFVKQVVEGKGRQAVRFAILLDETLILEKELWPNVFERLATAGVKIPAPREICNGLLRDVFRAATAVGADTTLFRADSDWVTSYTVTCKKAVSNVFLPGLVMNRTLYGT